MSEIKGQLLGMLMVLLVFGAVAGALFATFKGTSEQITSRAAQEVSMVVSNN